MCRSLLKVTTTAAMSTWHGRHSRRVSSPRAGERDSSQRARHAEDQEECSHRHREGERVEHEQAGEAGA